MMALNIARYDAVVNRPPATTALVPNGIFTLTLPDGGHRTFRIYTKRQTAKFAPGQRIIAILVGPDNTNDYEDWGFVTDQGIKPWAARRSKKYEEYAAVLWEILAGGGEVVGYELTACRKCLVCNRPLTTPESIEAGIGPECAERYGD